MIPFRNLRQLLSMQAKASPEKLFLAIHQPGSETQIISYAELNARAHQTANLLQDGCGLMPGQTLALIDDQAADVAVILLACWLIGAVVVMVPLHDEAQVVSRLGDEVITVGIVRGAERTARLRAQLPDLPLLQIGGAAVDDWHFDSLVARLSNTFFNDAPEPSLESPALRLAGHMLTQRDVIEAAQTVAQAHAISGNQNLLSSTGLSGMTGLLPLLVALLTGSSLTLALHHDPAGLFRQITAARAHVAFVTGSELEQAVQFGDAQQTAGRAIYGDGLYQQDIRQLRHFFCPPHHLTTDLLRRFTDRYGQFILTGAVDAAGRYQTLMPIDWTWDAYRHWLLKHAPALCLGCPVTPTVDAAAYHSESDEAGRRVVYASS